MKSFHVAQNCLILPLLDELALRGSNVNDLVRKSGLHRFELKNPDTYIPLVFYYKLLEEIKSLGVDDFLSQFYHVQQVRNLSTYGEQVHLTPNLLEACKFAEQHNHLLLSNEVITVEVRGPESICKVDLIGERHTVWDDIELLTLGQIIHAVRLAAGDDWFPQEIHLRTENMPDLDPIFLGKNHPNIRLGQACTQLVFQTRILTNKICLNPKNISLEYSNIKSYSGKVASILSSSNSIPTITEMANFFEISISSLKRTLATENQTYFDLVDNWRLKNALQLVENSDWQIKEIAQYLRFANSANFSRAFKRWTNLYPEIYRAQL